MLREYESQQGKQFLAPAGCKYHCVECMLCICMRICASEFVSNEITNSFIMLLFCFCICNQCICIWWRFKHYYSYFLAIRFHFTYFCSNWNANKLLCWRSLKQSKQTEELWGNIANKCSCEYIGCFIRNSCQKRVNCQKFYVQHSSAKFSWKKKKVLNCWNIYF